MACAEAFANKCRYRYTLSVDLYKRSHAHPYARIHTLNDQLSSVLVSLTRQYIIFSRNTYLDASVAVGQRRPWVIRPKGFVLVLKKPSHFTSHVLGFLFLSVQKSFLVVRLTQLTPTHIMSFGLLHCMNVLTFFTLPVDPESINSRFCALRHPLVQLHLPYRSVVSCARLTTSPCYLLLSPAVLFSW